MTLSATATAIVWACQVCGLPVDDEHGYITLSYEELGEHERAQREHEAKLDAKYPREPDKIRAIPVSDFVDGPGLVRWRILHRLCDPRPDSGDYWIAVERIRSQAQALEWCAHLLETKNWLEVTDWPRIARLAAGGVRA